jgi:nicotinamide mononucleotide adenylyltransferase
MKEAILHDIFAKKEIRKIEDSYSKYDPAGFAGFRVPEVTIHGRFQPPLHVNHFYTYVATGFRIAEKVHILITNPDLDEADVTEAIHRNTGTSNPFTYDERIRIFKGFFRNIGIPESRFDFKPFNITDENGWGGALEKDIPNLVNAYSRWSMTKLVKFRDKGYKVIHSRFPKIVNVSGTSIRKILQSDLSGKEMKEALLNGGLMPEAIESVLEVFEDKG